MNLLLLSLAIDAVPEFLDQTAPAQPRIGYLGAAADTADGAEFAAEERARIDALGHPVVEVVPGPELPDIDVLYVAGGNTFVLAEALRRTGLDRVIVQRVRAGLPYIGLSAGSIIAGPSLEPATLMDDPAEAPTLTDRTGLGLIDRVVLPHADGQLPPYPPTLIAETLRRYQDEYDIVPLADQQAIRVTGDVLRVIG